MVMLHFTFLRNCQAVSQRSCRFTSSSAVFEGSDFSISSPTLTTEHVFLTLAILVGGKVVSPCSFNWHFPNGMVSTFSHVYRPFVYLLWANVCSNLCPLLKCVVFLLLSVSALYVFWIQMSHQIHDLHIFSPIVPLF